MNPERDIDALLAGCQASIQRTRQNLKALDVLERNGVLVSGTAMGRCREQQIENLTSMLADTAIEVGGLAGEALPVG